MNLPRLFYPLIKVELNKNMDSILYKEVSKTVNKIQNITITEILTLDYIMKTTTPTANIHDSI